MEIKHRSQSLPSFKAIGWNPREELEAVLGLFLFWEERRQSSPLRSETPGVTSVYLVFRKKDTTSSGCAMTHKTKADRESAFSPRAYSFTLENSKLFLFGIAFFKGKKINSNTTRSFSDVDNLEYDCNSGAQFPHASYGQMHSLDQSDLGRCAVANGMWKTKPFWSEWRRGPENDTWVPGLSSA